MKLLFIAFVLFFKFTRGQNLYDGFNLVYVTGDEFEYERMGQWIYKPEGQTLGPELVYWDDTPDEIQYSHDSQFSNSGIISLIAHGSHDQSHIRNNKCEFPSWFPQEDPYSYFPYASAEITSKQLFKYGYFEMEFIPPSGLGLWPAFWLTYGDPNLEIDIFEMEGDHMELFKSDIHCNVPSGCDHRSETHHLPSGQYFTDGPHKIGLYWNKDNNWLSWFLDGVLVRDFQHTFSLGLRIIADLSVGSWCTGFPGPPNSSSYFPAQFKINYIRVYYPIDCNEIVNLPNYVYDINYGSVITGGTINLAGLGGNVLIRGANWNEDASRHYGDYVSFIASNEVNINEGFETEFEGSVDIEVKGCHDHSVIRPTSVHQNDIPQFINLPQIMNSSSEEEFLANNEYPLNNSIRKNNLSIYIYPNPATKIINIKSANESLIGNYKILNILGSEILSGFSIDNSLKIDLSDLEKGFYLFENDNGNKNIQKFILN